jgi:hypothetical protein
MGQANVKKWVDDTFQKKADGKKVCPPRCFAQRFDQRASG